jgi:hypothetical protein
MPESGSVGCKVQCNSRVVDERISLPGRKKSVPRDCRIAAATVTCSDDKRIVQDIDKTFAGRI